MRKRTVVVLASLIAATAFGAKENPAAKTVNGNVPANSPIRSSEVNPYGALQGAKGAETKETRYILKGTVERTEGDQVWIRSEGGQVYQVDSAGLTYHRGLFSNDKVEAVIGGTTEHMQAFRILSPAQEDIAD